MANITYTEIGTKKYMLREDLKIEQKRLVFRLRTKMTDFGENFRGGRTSVMCPLCKLHLDSQELSYKCPVIISDANIIGKNEDI